MYNRYSTYILVLHRYLIEFNYNLRITIIAKTGQDERWQNLVNRFANEEHFAAEFSKRPALLEYVNDEHRHSAHQQQVSYAQQHYVPNVYIAILYNCIIICYDTSLSYVHELTNMYWSCSRVDYARLPVVATELLMIVHVLQYLHFFIIVVKEGDFYFYVFQFHSDTCNIQ